MSSLLDSFDQAASAASAAPKKKSLTDSFDEIAKPAPAPTPAPTPSTAAPKHWWQVSEAGQKELDQMHEDGQSSLGATVGQLGLHVGSTAIGSLAGLVRAAGAGLSGDSYGEAMNKLESTRDALTYQPPEKSGGRMVLDALGSKYSPLSWLAQGTQALGDKALAVTGSPAIATLADVGINAAATMGMGKLAGAVVKPRGVAAPVSPPVARAEPAFAPAPAPVAVAPPATNLALEPQVPVPARSPGFPGQEPAVAAQPVAAPTAPQAAPVQAPPVAAPVSQSLPPPKLEHASDDLQLAVARAQERGTPINPTVLQRHVEADTLPVPLRLSEGQATLDPATISQEMNSRGGKAPAVPPEFYNSQGKALAQNLDVIRKNAAPDVTADNPTDHGQVLVDQYKAMDAPVVADIAAKYKAIEDANGGEFPLDGQKLAANTKAALDKALKSKSVPADLQSNLDEFANGRQMTFQDFETMRSDAADAQRTATDGRQRAAAAIVREQLEAMPLTPAAAGLKPLADQARAAAKARFDAMRADPAYDAAVNDDAAHGHPSPLADNFVQKFLIGAPRANVLKMRQNLGDSPLAQQTIPAATVDYLRAKAKADVETGQFNAASYNGVVDKLSPKFDALMDPASAATLQQVGNVAKYTTVQPKGSFVNNSNTLVGMGVDVAKDRIGSALNNFTLGASGTIAGIAKGVGQVKAAKAATAPGAGITKLSDLAPPQD